AARGEAFAGIAITQALGAVGGHLGSGGCGHHEHGGKRGCDESVFHDVQPSPTFLASKARTITKSWGAGLAILLLRLLLLLALAAAEDATQQLLRRVSALLLLFALFALLALLVAGLALTAEA